MMHTGHLRLRNWRPNETRAELIQAAKLSNRMGPPQWRRADREGGGGGMGAGAESGGEFAAVIDHPAEQGEQASRTGGRAGHAPTSLLALIEGPGAAIRR